MPTPTIHSASASGHAEFFPDFAKAGGLVPAIVQCAATGEVLMLAYMNEESYRKTLETGEAHFWSRSRQSLWHKGGTSGHVQSRYLYPDEGELPPNGTYGFLVITADKGLAGAYNQNVLKEAHRLLQEHPQTKLFVVGEYGRQYFQRHQVPIERSFLYTAQNPTMQRAREITAELLDRFDKGELQKIFVIYTDMKNSLTENVSATRILPFHRSAFTAPTDEKRITEPFEFFPSVTQVLENIVPSYVSGFIYSTLIDSFCSEQSARMNAMNSANENAEKMLGELALAYNRIRQAAITQEITEIVAGAEI